MSFRDETEALRQRIGEQERALAGLDGRRLGLEASVAEKATELAQHARSRARRSATSRAWRITRYVIGLVAGLAGGIFVTGGGCLLIPMTIDAMDGPDPVHLVGAVAESARADVAPGSVCEIAVTGADDECDATIECAGRTLAQVKGRCSVLPRTGGVSFWTPPGPARARAVVIAEPRARAAIAGPQGTVAITILKRR